MDIELSLLSKEIIFILLICKDLNLNFKEIKKLYLGSDKVFFKYLYHFFNALKITEDRLSKISKLSSIIYNKIINDNIVISNRDKQYYDYVIRHLKNKYECDGKLYDFKYFKDYINIDKEGKKIVTNILLYNGNYLCNITEYDLYYYKNKIYKIILNLSYKNKEDKVIFTNTSDYSFIKKDECELPSIKINPIIKITDKIEINRKEDILNLVKENIISINKDLYINCDLELDTNIKCKNIYSQHTLNIGNLDAININVKNLIANTVIALNINTENIDAKSITAYNNIKSNNINYCSVCYAHQNIECNSIKGERRNSKHFVLDGEIIING